MHVGWQAHRCGNAADYVRMGHNSFFSILTLSGHLTVKSSTTCIWAQRNKVVLVPKKIRKGLNAKAFHFLLHCSLYRMLPWADLFCASGSLGWESDGFLPSTSSNWLTYQANNFTHASCMAPNGTCNHNPVHTLPCAKKPTWIAEEWKNGCRMRGPFFWGGRIKQIRHLP